MTAKQPNGCPVDNRRTYGNSNEGHKVMRQTLLSATILMGLAAPAWATGINNDIEIDATTAGSVTTLAIVQDATNLANQVSSTSTRGTQLAIAGPWDTVSISQMGGSNLFTGSLKAHSGSTIASLTASYAGGNNTQSLTVGFTTAPADPHIAIDVTNTVGGTNTITDTFDGTALNYNLALVGTGNSVTNTVASTGAITLNQGGGAGAYGINGSGNSVTNTVGSVTPVGSFTHNMLIGSDGNTINNIADEIGNKMISQSISTLGGSTLSMTLNGAGNQTATMNVDSGSKVNYTLIDSAAGATANILLSNVQGDSSAPAVINVTQTALAVNATANVTIVGSGFTMGALSVGGPGVDITQNSLGANLNMTYTASANGYTVHVTQ
jgi:hypothetical protein